MKARKKRAKETRPRNRPEDAFRRELIDYLKRQGVIVRRVEPAVRGVFGLGDLFVFNLKTRWAGWIEIKAPMGRLSDDQKEVKSWCNICGVKYIVAKTLDDVGEVVG